MIGLPHDKQRVKVWPVPGRQVQANEHPVDRWGGGHYLAKSGEEVIWSSFHHEQLKAGDILLHPPPCDEHSHPKVGEGKEQSQGPCEHCGRTVDDAKTYDATRPTDRKPKMAKAEAKPYDPGAATTQHMKHLLGDKWDELGKDTEKPAAPAAPAVPADSSKK